jgi:hypothetical protein
MSISDLRQELEEIRASAQRGDHDQVIQKVDEALRTLDGGQLLTTTQAAALLGIRSVNTLKLLVRRMGLRHEMHGNRMMIPLAELEGIQDSSEVRGIRASDRAHDAIDAHESDQGLTPDQLEDLEAARPGRVPWES